jgi:ATP-binding cassette subfamily G (WHITE) protein 2 (PDR)
MYSWAIFLLGNFIVELACQMLMSVKLFVCWYYPTGMQRNGEATHDVGERSEIVFLFIWSFTHFTLSLSSLVAAGMKSAVTTVNIAQLLYSLSLMFCGVLARPFMLPRFWKFMYRVTPLTYYNSGLITACLGNTLVRCSAAEVVHIPIFASDDASSTMDSCEAYLQELTSEFGGIVVSGMSHGMCPPLSSDQYDGGL